MDFIVKRHDRGAEQVSGTSLLIRPGRTHYAICHVVDRGRVVYTATSDRIEIQDCGDCLAISLGQVPYRRLAKPAWTLDLPPAA